MTISDEVIHGSTVGQGRITFRDGSVRGYGSQTIERLIQEGAVGRLTKCLYEAGLYRLVPFIEVNRTGDVRLRDLLDNTDEENLLLVCRAWWLASRHDPRMGFNNEYEVLEWYLRP